MNLEDQIKKYKEEKEIAPREEKYKKLLRHQKKNFSSQKQKKHYLIVLSFIHNFG